MDLNYFFHLTFELLIAKLWFVTVQVIFGLSHPCSQNQPIKEFVAQTINPVAGFRVAT